MAQELSADEFKDPHSTCMYAKTTLAMHDIPATCLFQESFEK